MLSGVGFRVTERRHQTADLCGELRTNRRFVFHVLTSPPLEHIGALRLSRQCRERRKTAEGFKPRGQPRPQEQEHPKTPAVEQRANIAGTAKVEPPISAL